MISLRTSELTTSVTNKEDWTFSYPAAKVIYILQWMEENILTIAVQFGPVTSASSQSSPYCFALVSFQAILGGQGASYLWMNFVHKMQGVGQIVP